MSEPLLIDHGKMGIRGPVRECAEVTTLYSALTANRSESQFRNDFDFDGKERLTARTDYNPDGSEGVTHFSYDNSGLLLKSTYKLNGSVLTEVEHQYDELGRIQKITSSAGSRGSAVYIYDQQGKRTKIQTSTPEDYRPNITFGGSLFEANDHAPNLPLGGTATTMFDDRSRPCEVEVRDDQGQLVKRVVRTFNERGLVAEEAEFLPDPTAILPRQFRDQFLQRPGASIEELREKLRKIVGVHVTSASVKFEYDTQGRVVRTRRRIFNREDEINSSYNEHGEVAKSVTREVVTDLDADVNPRYSETICSYQYDSQGNWTEKIASHRLSPDGAFNVTLKTTRTLAYY